MNVLDQLPDRPKILVVRLRSLGDCVLTTPALRLLKQARPGASIGVVVEPRFDAVFAGNPDVDSVLPPAAGAVWRFGAGLTINFHGGTRSLALTALSCARWRAGFAHYRHGQVHNVKMPRAQEILGVERQVHTAEHLASAVFYLGAPRAEIPRACLFARPARRKRPWAVIHPFAARPDKTWPAGRFVAAAEHIEREHGLEPVFIGGPGDDMAPFARHACVSGPPLEETKSLLAGASLFVGNDSGPAHMAAAFGLPVVVLFAISDPVVWAPWKTRAEQIVAPEGMAAIELERVAAAIGRVRGKA